MKKYKNNFVFSPIFQLCNFLLAASAGFIVPILWLRPKEWYWLFVAWAVIILLFVVVGNVIHYLLSVSSPYTSFVDDNALTVKYNENDKGKVINFSDVKFVTFDCGAIPLRGSPGRACSIILSKEKGKSSLTINNPSFLLITQIIKRCKLARFRFNNYKWYLFWCGFSVVCSVIVCLCSC